MREAVSIREEAPYEPRLSLKEDMALMKASAERKNPGVRFRVLAKEYPDGGRFFELRHANNTSPSVVKGLEEL